MAKSDGNAGYPTLADILDKCAADHGDKAAIAVMDGGPMISHAQLKVAVERLGQELRRTGVKPGDLVSLAFPNTLEFVVAFLAVTRIRCVAAPLNAAYTEDEFRFYMEDAASKLLLLPAGKPSAPAQAAAASLHLPLALIHPLLPSDSDAQVKLTPDARLVLLAPEAGGQLGGGGDRPVGDDEALFLHTSGTTSRPKGVPLTHTNLAASIGNIIKHYRLGAGDKSLVVMPLFHVHGLMAALLSTLAAGGTALLPAGGRFSASSFWKDIREGGATWFTAVPTMHQILLARHKQQQQAEGEGDVIPRLRFIRSCSASLAPAVLAKLEEAFKAPVLEAYAMTEAAHQMCANPLPSDGPHKPGTVGKPTGIDLAILDSEGRKLPPGQVGEVCLTGPNVTKGYKNNPEANAACFTFDYFHTGDQGKVDADGYLELVGRIKELINRGGEKISPMEVDAALLAHPAVAEAVAFGAPDELYGEEVNAAVMLHAGQSASQEDIQTFLKKQLAPFKIPKRIFFTNEVPRTATGKIQRRFVAQVFLAKKEAPAAAAAAAAASPPVLLDGNEIAAQALFRLGIRYMFGVVGIPVTYFATAAQKAGIRFIAFRNEQAAGYAAGACGYLTGVPGALLTVSGPGCVHGLAGLSNAMINTWPMVMVSGSSCQADIGKGDFQELDQLAAVRPFVKYGGKAKSLSDIPSVVETAVRASVTGRPGGSYIDLPSDLLHQTLPLPQVAALLSTLKAFSPSWAHPPPPATFSLSPPLPPASLLQHALSLLKSAERPLLVIGKGAGYARAESALSEFVGVTGIPFVATPMGKGVLPDTHPLSAGAARSLALSQADVVLVVGARLNWMLHFGEEPKWGRGVKFVLIEADAGEVELRKPAVGLVGDAKAVMEALNGMVKGAGVGLGEQHPWRAAIKAKAGMNASKLAATLAADVTPLNFHCSLRIIRDAISAVGSPAPILVSEGANTMDVGRTVLEQTEPRTRLDAGTWGTMGVGLGYAIGAAVAVPGRLVVAVEGDSAFGFSGMEMETIVRYALPIVVIVMNNGGVYGGDRRGAVDIPEPYHNDPAPTSFVAGIKYDLLMNAFGGKGYSVDTPAELAEAVREAFAAKKPALINVTIDPFAGAESGRMTHRN